MRPNKAPWLFMIVRWRLELIVHPVERIAEELSVRKRRRRLGNLLVWLRLENYRMVMMVMERSRRWRVIDEMMVMKHTRRQRLRLKDDRLWRKDSPRRSWCWCMDDSAGLEGYVLGSGDRIRTTNRLDRWRHDAML